MRLIMGLFFLFVMTGHGLYSQPAQDTVEMAKQLRDKGKLKAALKLLEPYHTAHPSDLNAAWVFAQTAFWAKRFALSGEIYEMAIWYHPENLFLQFDYASMLVDIGKYDKAMPYLKNFLLNYPDNPDVKRLYAKIAYRKGNFKEAEEEIAVVMANDPGDQQASSLQCSIRQAKSPTIGIKASYFSDDQPLQTISPVMENAIWLHPLATLRFSLQAPFFLEGASWSNALWLQAGNSAFIGKGNWTIITDVGVLKYPYKNTVTWTGNLEVKKRSFRHLITAVQAERKPYFSTGSSIDTVINEYHVAFAAGWDDADSWNGQIAYIADYFPVDKNLISAFAAWGFAPPLKVSTLDFRLGYGFNYSTSQVDHFEPVGKKADIIALYDPAVGIKGVYYPYFTPNSQLTHSALIAIGFHPGKVVDLGINGNLGVYTTAQIPYLYLDTNGAGGYAIKKGFSKERYFPVTVSLFAAIQVSEKISLRADYRYSRTYFYTEHYTGLHLTIHLWHAKKRK